MNKTLIILSLLIIVVITQVSAYDTFKWQICTALNFSGGQCDDWWVAFRGTTEENITLDNYLNISQTRTEINNTIDSYLINYLNSTYISALVNDTNHSINISDCVTYQQFDEEKNYSRTRMQRIEDNNLNPAITQSTSSGSGNWAIIILANIIVIGIILVIGFMARKRLWIVQNQMEQKAQKHEDFQENDNLFKDMERIDEEKRKLQKEKEELEEEKKKVKKK